MARIKVIPEKHREVYEAYLKGAKIQFQLPDYGPLNWIDVPHPV